MKKLILIILPAVFLFACTKSDSNKVSGNNKNGSDTTGVIDVHASSTSQYEMLIYYYNGSVNVPQVLVRDNFTGDYSYSFKGNKSQTFNVNMIGFTDGQKIHLTVACKGLTMTNKDLTVVNSTQNYALGASFNLPE